MWERFSYYGMRALLALYMTTATTHVIMRDDGTAVANGGMGLDIGTAAAIYGLYTSLVYILALPGGWVADNLWGQRKAVWVGGWIIAAGHFTMAVPSTFTFFLGLALIVCGTGLLKPNVSTIVGELYPEGRREAGRRLLRLLHGDQPGGPARASRDELSRRGLQLALGLRGGRRGHGAGAHSVPEPRPAAGRCGPAEEHRQRRAAGGEVAQVLRKRFSP